MVKKKFNDLSFLAFLTVFIVGSFIFFIGHAGNGYSDVMRRANSGNSNFGDSRVYDIAILGSHDAMSDQINKNSAVDYNSEVPDLGVLMKLNLVKSIIVNYCRTQSVGLDEQLKAGVRYFDGRVTCKDGVFRTTHGLVSGKLEDYLKQLITFLLDNPGEFVLFHIAQCNTTEKSENDLAEFMQNVKVRRYGKDYSIYDFVNYDTSKNFSDVTYNDVTNYGRKGGVVIISGFRSYKVSNSNLRRYFANKNYCNTWYNKADPKKLLSMVDEVVEKYKDRDAFKCNGFQTTQNAKSIALNLVGSLINNAKSENIGVINHPHFDYWLSCMPIVCFDEVVSTKGNFNSKVNSKILNYNLNLNRQAPESKYKKITSESHLKDGMKLVIKGVHSTSGYRGDDFKQTQVGRYIGNQFILEDRADRMWTLKKSGNSWKIKMPNGNYLDRNIFGYLVATKKESSAIVFKFNFTSSGTVKIYNDKNGMYIDSKGVLDISKKRGDELEVYGW